MSVVTFSLILFLFSHCAAGDGGSGACPFSAANEPDHHGEHHHHVHHHHHRHHAPPREQKLPEELAEEEDLAMERLADFNFQDQEVSRIPAGKPSKVLVDCLAVFGAGAMLGDAFLHQLPHAFGGDHSHGHDHHHSHDDHFHSHDHDHSHAHSIKDLSVGLSVLAGILVFLLVEKMVRYIEGSSGHAHHHHHINDKKHDDKGVKASKGKLSKPTSQNSSSPKVEGERASSLVFGYLNLFSDGVHNFTDGMALGSAFLLHGAVGGWSTTLFLLAHELPQEIGDFGILVRSGFSVSKALLFNFLSALVALAGTALALFLGKDPGHSSLIEAFTAGGFIYISVAGVLPEMNSGSPTVKSSILHTISFIFGIAVALCISLVE